MSPGFLVSGSVEEDRNLSDGGGGGLSDGGRWLGWYFWWLKRGEGEVLEGSRVKGGEGL